MKFPVDTKEPGEIPAFDDILSRVPECGGLLKFLCYRYDPKCDKVREAAQANRNGIASALADWPEDGQDIILISNVVDAFFIAFNDFEYEIMCSREIVLEQTLSQMREEFDTDEKDPDKISKAFLLKVELDKKADEIWNRLSMLYDKIADGDKEIEKALKESRGARREWAPEKR
jgi:hypothetical protein